MKLEIVSHCWHYSRPLIFQLSSLHLFPPAELSVIMTVLYCEDDSNTVEVLRYFSRLSPPSRVTLRPWALPSDRITRRMIGRNLAALATEADWVWFTDCDYTFRAGCLDSIGRWSPAADGRLFFPGSAHLSKSHAEGDSELSRVTQEASLVDVDPTKYVPKRFHRAIGGIQIVTGQVARRIGYCRHSRLLDVPSPSWAHNHDDIWFRRSLGTGGVSMDVPGLYRIRHSRRGGPLLEGASLATTDAELQHACIPEIPAR